MLKIIAAGLIIATTFLTGLGQSDAADGYVQSKQHTILEEFIALLRMPNVASDTESINTNAQYLAGELKKRGLEAAILGTDDPSVPPSVYGEWLVPGAKKTIVFYAHYDGQPVDPENWTGSTPWSPVLRSGSIENGGKIIARVDRTKPINPEWRLYARSASDDKGGVLTILKALDVLRTGTIKPTVNIKIFFEGEEEAGSSHLAKIIALNKKRLKADAWIICDGPVHQSGRKQVVFGVRGVTSVDLTIYGANRDLHSGHYGNWSPNPGMTLARLLATMKDADGRVVVKGWYDDVEQLGEAELAAIEAAPQFDSELKKQLGLNTTDGNEKSLLELISMPSLNINGMKAGNVGVLARNVIPASANAVLGLRLVKGNDHLRQIEKLRNHIVEQGFYVVDREPTAEERLKHPLIAKFVGENSGYNAQRTRMDLPVSKAVIAAVSAAADGKIVALPTLGGSLPLSIISEGLDDVPTITVPIANYDNNQHAANENIRIGNLWDGIRIYVNLMTMNLQ